MPLPSIVMPAGLPGWLAQGNGLTLGSAVVPVPFSTGHPRRRRVTTGAEHTVAVALHLKPSQAVIFDAFFEDDLEAGVLRFAARVHSLEETVVQWWDALFIAQPSWVGVPGDAGVQWRVDAQLHLRGEPSTSPP